MGANHINFVTQLVYGDLGVADGSGLESLE